MARKKDVLPEGAAEEDVRPEPEALAEEPMPETDRGPQLVEPENASEPAAEPAEPELLEPRQWAARKGHIPKPGPVSSAGKAHRGPHLQVVLVHTRWPGNKLVSEAEYDDAVTAAYSIPMRDSWVHHDAVLASHKASSEPAKG